MSEHGDFYEQGIKPAFSAMKQRTYDSYWNWSRVDVLLLYNQLSNGEISHVDEATSVHIANRGTKELLDILDALKSRHAVDGWTLVDAATPEVAVVGWLDSLRAKVVAVLHHGAPKYRAIFDSLAPETTISEDGEIFYSELHEPVSTLAWTTLLRRGMDSKED